MFTGIRKFKVEYRKYYPHQKLGSKKDEHPESINIPVISFRDPSSQNKRETMRQSA
jgi:hypothetical protein